MPTVCPGINSLYTQWSVKLLFFFPWFCLFLSSCGFFEREACLFRDKPRLLCCSSPLSLIHKPDGSSSSSTFSFCLFFFLPCNLSSPPPFLSPMSNFEFSLPSFIKLSSFASLSHLIFNSFSNLSSEHQKNPKTNDLVRFRAIHGRRAF